MNPINPVLAAALSYYGAPPLVAAPKDVIDGPFYFGGTITDNATTAINLLDSDAWATDVRIEQFFGTADNPDMSMLLTGIQVICLNAQESATKWRELRRSLYLEHIDGADTYRVNLFDAICIEPDVRGFDGAASEKTIYGLRRGEPVTLPVPRLVNFRTHQLNIQLQAAVDFGANMPVDILLFGCAWNGAKLGAIQPVPFPTNPMEGNRLRGAIVSGQDLTANRVLGGSRRSILAASGMAAPRPR